MCVCEYVSPLSWQFLVVDLTKNRMECKSWSDKKQTDRRSIGHIVNDESLQSVFLILMPFFWNLLWSIKVKKKKKKRKKQTHIYLLSIFSDIFNTYTTGFFLCIVSVQNRARNRTQRPYKFRPQLDHQRKKKLSFGI